MLSCAFDKSSLLIGRVNNWVVKIQSQKGRKRVNEKDFESKFTLYSMFLYVFSVCTEKAQDLLVVTDMLQMSDIKTMACEFLENKIDTINCLGMGVLINLFIYSYIFIIFEEKSHLLENIQIKICFRNYERKINVHIQKEVLSFRKY